MAVIVSNLMKEWNPIKASVTDLKETMGTPTREEAGVLEYVFDNGRFGHLWRFTVLEDVVVGVSWDPLD